MGRVSLLQFKINQTCLNVLFTRMSFMKPITPLYDLASQDDAAQALAMLSLAH